MTARLVLNQFLPFRLSVLSNAISRRLAETYSEQFGLTVWQWRVMAILAEDGDLTATQITARTHMDKVAVSRAVAGLIEDGRLQKRTSPDDGRRAFLCLTEAGQQDYDQIVPLALASESKLTSALTPEELATFTDLLVKVAKTVDDGTDLW